MFTVESTEILLRSDYSNGKSTDFSSAAAVMSNLMMNWKKGAEEERGAKKYHVWELYLTCIFYREKAFFVGLEIAIWWWTIEPDRIRCLTYSKAILLLKECTTGISKLVAKSHPKPGIDLPLFACVYKFAIMLQKNLP